MNTYLKKPKYKKSGIRKDKYRYGTRPEPEAVAEILRLDSVLAAINVFVNYDLRTKVLDTLYWIAQKTKNIEDIAIVAETFAVFAGSGMEGKIAELLKISVIKDRLIVKDISRMLIDRKDLAEASSNIFPMLVYIYSNIEDADIKRDIPLHYLEDVVYAYIAALKNYKKITDRYNEPALQKEFFQIMKKKIIHSDNLEEKIEKLNLWALSVAKDLRRYDFIFN